MTLKWLRIVWFSGVVLFGLGLIALYLLLATETGNRYLLTQVMKQEPRFSAILVRGDLFSHLELADVAWRSDSVTLSIRQASYQWDWSCLFNSRVCVSHLVTDGLELTLKETVTESGEGAKKGADYSTEPQLSQELDWLHWPVAFELHNLEMSNTRLAIYDHKVAWQQLKLDLIGQNADTAERKQLAQLLLQNMTVDALEVVIVSTDDTTTHSDSATNLDDIVLPRVHLPLSIIAEPVTFTSARLTLIDSANNSPLAANAEDKSPAPLLDFSQLKLHASMQGEKVDVKQLSAVMPEISAELVGNIMLEEPYVLKLDSNIEVRDMAPLSNSQYQLQAQGSVRELEVALSSRSLLNLDLNATLKPLTQGIPFDAMLTWKNMQWPLPSPEVTAPAWISQDGRLSVKGQLHDYQYQLNGQIQSDLLSTTSIIAAGNGDLQQLTIKRFKANSDAGQMAINGKLSWEPALAWNGDIEIQQLKLQPFVSALSGQLNANMSTSFHMTPVGWNMALSDAEFKGDIDGYPVQLSAELAGNMAAETHSKQPFGNWELSRFHLISNDNELQLTGQLADQWQADGVFKVTDLSTVVSAMQGSVAGELSVEGDAEDPRLLFQLSGKEWLLNLKPEPTAIVAAAQPQSKTTPNNAQTTGVETDSNSELMPLSIASWYANGELQPMQLLATHSRQGYAQNRFVLSANRVKYNEAFADNATLILRGDIANHWLTLSIDGAPISSKMAIQGHFNHSVWQGEVAQAWLSSPVGQWQLDRSFVLDYQLAAQQLEVSPHCWRFDPDQKPRVLSSGVNGPHSKGGSQANRVYNHQHIDTSICLTSPLFWGPIRRFSAQVKQFPLMQIQPFMPAEMAPKGLVDAQVDVDWPSNTKPTASLQASLEHGELALQTIEPGILQSGTIVFETLKLGVLLEPDNLALSVNMASPALGNGDIQLKTKPYQSARPLEGQLTLSEFSLDALAPFLPQIEALNGKLQADIGIEGKMTQPLLSGGITLNNVSAFGGQLPLELLDLSSDITFNGNRADIVATAKTSTFNGSGQSQLTGYVDWHQQLSGQFKLAGENIEVKQNSVRLSLSPRLDFTLEEQQMTLSGVVKIPYGRIKMRQLPKGAVTESADVIMADTDNNTEKSTVLPLILDLQVELEEDVKIDAFGLQSNLSGFLAVKQRPGAPLSGNGEIGLQDGTYKAWGQNLRIEQGQMIFSGPLDTPYLNVDAIRDPSVTQDNVVAGVRIVGSAAKPEVSIYSDPAMAQQDALSYLLRGRSLESGSDQGNDNAMAMMLMSLGIGQSEGVVSTLGNSLGVQDLSLSTSGQGDTTMLEVSGYILPGVELRYGVSMDNTSQITIRYELLHKLFIEGTSGFENALDLLYEFEL